MKALTAFVGVLLTAGVATAQTSSPSGTDDRSRSGSSAGSTTSTTSHASTQTSLKPIAVEVVSADAMGNTITVSPSSSSGRTTTATTATGRTQPVTLPVEGKATSKLKAVKAGDQLLLTCREVERTGSLSGTTGASGVTSNHLALLALYCSAVTEISKSRATASSPASDDTKR